MRAMFLAKVKLAAAVLIAAAVAATGTGAAVMLAAAESAGPAAPESPKPFGGAQGLERAERVERLKAAAANTWVKLVEEPDGYRDLPIFCYAPGAGKFVLAGGVSNGPQHFDTETFDAGAEKWINAYPAGAPYKNESGPSDAPSSGDTGWPTAAFQTDKAGVSRIRMDGVTAAYGTDTRLNAQYALDPVGGKLYAYFFDITAAYDPAERKWTDLKAAKFSKTPRFALMYGSLAYDPVNKEILSIGGTSNEPGGTPGTWAFNIAAGAWKKVETGSKELRALGTEAETLRVRTAALANLARNRFYATESEAEAKENLSAPAETLAADVAKLVEKLKAAKPAGAEENAPKVAAGEAEKLGAAVKALGAKLGGRISPEILAEAQAAVDLAARAARALDAEPAGRGYSPMASDLSAGKIVLFGGTSLDAHLSDTWVYDCKTRSWEQRWPKVAPSPRAGHILAWLPKGGRAVMYGGRNRAGQILPELWVYDHRGNEWKLLQRAPMFSGRLKYGEEPYPQDAPRRGPGAVDTNDVLVVVSHGYVENKPFPRITWGMKVDPSAPGIEPGKSGSAPGAVEFGLSPSNYDRVARPDPDAVGKLFKDLPANKWTLLAKSPCGSPTRDWGTLPYDTDRHQILHWGGGHSTYVGTEVGHYGLRTALWSTGYPTEDPPTRGFYAMADQSFHNRPHVPNHVWDAAAYDPVSKKGVWCVRGGTWTYDPAVREWDYPPTAAPGGELGVSMGSTPKGAVCWVNETLQLFDAKARTWSKLPLAGGKIGGAYGDSSGICYDSKRDCLWLGHNGDPMMRYAMAGGALTVIPGKGLPGCFMRETVYVPEIDMLLNEIRVSGEGAAGNLAYDIENNKWVGLDLPFTGKEQYLSGRDYWATTGSRSLHYDPELKLAIFFYGDQEVAVVRLDKASLKTFEVKLQEPKK